MLSGTVRVAIFVVEDKNPERKKMNRWKKSLEYIRSDYYRYVGRKDSLFTMWLYSFKNPCFNFSMWFRWASYGVWGPVGKIFHQLVMRRTGIWIQARTQIGYGLYIGHGIGLVVNPTTRIGNNCNLSQFMTIGANNGKAAVIGDNVYIGPSVCIVEDVVIGDNATIGAGAVVVKDVPVNATVAGVPARIVSYKTPGRYIGNRWEC